MSDTPPPPEIVHLLDLIGDAATLRLLEAHGGTRVYFAQTPPPGSALAEVVGEEAARLLGRAYGRQYMRVPLAKAWRARIYRRQGMSYSAIARRLGCSENSVCRHLAPAAPAARQMALPF